LVSTRVVQHGVAQTEHDWTRGGGRNEHISVSFEPTTVKFFEAGR